MPGAGRTCCGSRWSAGGITRKAGGPVRLGVGYHSGATAGVVSWGTSTGSPFMSAVSSLAHALRMITLRRKSCLANTASSTDLTQIIASAYRSISPSCCFTVTEVRYRRSTAGPGRQMVEESPAPPMPGHAGSHIAAGSYNPASPVHTAMEPGIGASCDHTDQIQAVVVPQPVACRSLAHPHPRLVAPLAHMMVLTAAA